MFLTSLPWWLTRQATGSPPSRPRSTIYDLPFLSEKAKHKILGGTAARLFKLKPRNEKQKENLIRFGNYTAAA